MLNAQYSGSIIGNISDHQGQPLEFVSISLKGTNIGTVTDQTGTFELRRVLSDDYTLVVSYVGFHTEVRQITVMPNQTTTVPTLILTPNMQELEGVVVSSAAQIFAEKKSETVARLPIANLENSQVYTVVPKELLKEQMTSDFRTALMSSPGVTNVVLGVGSGGTGLSMRMRGFSGDDGAGSIRNGMATNFVSLSDPVNLERLEIIKGPSSTLFGSTLISYGGLVNRVTKKPLGYQSTELSFSAGSYGLGRVTLDYNTPLNKDNTFLFRFNTAIHRENSFQDQGINRTYMIAPAFSYIVNENLKINMDLEFFKTKRNSTYVGLTPSAGISNFDQLEWDFKRSYASNDITSTAEVLNVFANAEYTLDEHWTSDTRFSYSNTDNNANYLFLLVKAGEGAYQGEHLLQRRLMNLPSNFNTTQIQQNLTGIHQWGNVSNKFLVGVDYTQLTTTDSRTMINDYDALNDQVTVLNQDAPVINVNTYQTALSQTNRAANH